MSVQPAPSSTRRPLLALLLLVALTLAVPIALELYDVVADPRRRLDAVSGGLMWAAVALSFTLAGIVALALRPSGERWRLALALGVALSLVAVSGASAWQRLGSERPLLPGCGTTELVAVPLSLEAQTSVDGQPRAELSTTANAELAVALVEELAAGAVEDAGDESVAGVATRHCRALSQGSRLIQAVPQLAEGTDASGPLVPTELPIWRGEVDWWISADRRLIGVQALLGGHPADAWPVDGLAGELRVEMWPTGIIAP